MLKSGEAEQALELLAPAVERTKDHVGDGHYDTAELRGFQAMAIADLGDDNRALNEFEIATEIQRLVTEE